jgi:hypothetical protein
MEDVPAAQSERETGTPEVKDYPSTYPFEPKYTNVHCTAFYKYDGSNLRFEYNRRSKRWYKFGTRRRLFDHNDPEYGQAIPLFMNKYADGLVKVFHDSREWRNAENMIAYAELTERRWNRAIDRAEAREVWRT